MKKIGYNVYHAPEGGAESYLGFVKSLKAAKKLAAHGGRNELPEYLYDTARAAGHVYGLSAPDKENEASEPSAWFGGRGGYYCAVPVFIARRLDDDDD